MAEWQLTIHGGFAWVFAAGDASATIGPFRKPGGGPNDHHPHEMLLRVPQAAFTSDRQAETTLPYRMERGAAVFVLRDTVTLLPDGKPEATSGLVRRNSGNAPAADDYDDFYYVYSVNRLRDPGTPPGRLVADWRERLLARLEIRDGVLTVLAPRFTAPYRITNGPRTVHRALATHIVYAPKSTPRFVIFSTPHGIVSANRADFVIAAECGCPDDRPAGRPIPGFGVTFDLFDNAGPDLRLVPHFPDGFGGNAARLDPGPDCPPRDYSI